MNSSSAELNPAAATIVAETRRRMAGSTTPFVVALDGPSGSGKSTLAGLIAAALDAVVLPGDDFFAADITDAGWDARGPEARAADAIDWRRLRAEALDPLRAGK